MEIVIITGQRNGNLSVTGDYKHIRYFPEQITLHPYKLSERILKLCDMEKWNLGKKEFLI